MSWDKKQDIEYLREGTASQRKAYQIITSTRVLYLLEPFNPLVVGTIPIDIDIDDSDIDIICYVDDLPYFRDWVRCFFSAHDSFTDRLKDKGKVYIASFFYDSKEIEIYAKNQPTYLQNGYRHMIIEEKLLNLGGKKFKTDIINLKRAGYKTEPAFGIVLNLENPYEDLLKMELLSDDELRKCLRNNNY